jgi:ribosomal protection tetracycline resistance protein
LRVTTLNLGIVAHVDAGKTSLTERILYETHVIDEIGRVDTGTTQTDTLELEKRRGITIKASVVSFVVNDLKINLIDTPGHADFLAEVERSLSVLDGAILLISAVEGIQAQTRILFAALSKLRIPTIIFINKIDRSGAQADELIERIRQKLTARVIPLNQPAHIGTKQAAVIPNDLRDPTFLHTCIELLAPDDEQLLAAYVEGEAITAAQVRMALAWRVGQARLTPIFFGSAITGVGVSELLAALVSLLPSTTSQEDAPLSGVVFKLEKEATGEKVAYVRVFAGRLGVKTSVELQRRERSGEIEMRTGKIQQLHLFWEGKTVQVQSVGAGEFCKVWGLRDVKIGDMVGDWSDHIKTLHFATPRMETQIDARRHDQRRQLYQALLELAEEDPLIAVLRDEIRQAIYLRIFGEVQKEVIESMLLERYGLVVRFSETSIVCIEKPSGVGQAVERLGAPENPFMATVGLRIEPGPAGSGLTYRSPTGALKISYYRVMEEAARATLAQGLYGWELTDLVLTITETRYTPATTGSDFRFLTPLVVMEALARAGTDVYEPINQFELSAPAHAISVAMFKLSALGAVYAQPTLLNDTFVLTGALPVATTEAFRRELAAFTEGEGDVLVQDGGFRKMEGAFPTRRRMDFNPLNRKEYLLHVQRVR